MYRIVWDGKTEWNEQGQPKLMDVRYVPKLRMMRDILAQEIELQSLPAIVQEFEKMQSQV